MTAIKNCNDALRLGEMRKFKWKSKLDIIPSNNDTVDAK